MSWSITTAHARVAGVVLGLACATLPAAAAPATGQAAAQEVTDLERAFILDEGKEAPRDAAAAAAAYQKAAEQGEALAHLRLGYLFETGDGVPFDPAQARRHYEAAVAAGIPEARLRLAICHLEGWGGPVDRPAFAREVRAAAESGYAPAQRLLSTLCFLGFGVPKDPAQGVTWLEKAASTDPEAQLAMGHIQERKRALALMPDNALARNWYQLSAEQDYSDAMLATARTLLMGTTRDRNWELGHRWLELASEAGDAEAPYFLAFVEILHVDSPRRDEARALQWLNLSAERGNSRATEVLDLVAAGKPLAEAMSYLLIVPASDRYLQRQARLAADQSGQPNQVPTVYRMVRPVYPEALRMTRTTGEVQVQFVVDVQGRAKDVEAVQSTHPLFAQRAVEAVQQWRFHPGVHHGRPVNTRMRVPIKFDLKGEQLNGMDALLAAARTFASRKGIDEPTGELGLAIPRGRVPPPAGAEGARALFLLVIDPTGHPVRGHLLDARPESAGPLLLSYALGQDYFPRKVDGQPATSTVVYLCSFLKDPNTSRTLNLSPQPVKALH